MKHIEIMNDVARGEFNRFIACISKMDGVLRIYLFGSYSEGKPTESSDIDLMVVVQDGVNTLDFLQSVSIGIMNRRISLDVVADTVSDFAELSKPDRVTLQREIKRKGILVYGE